MPGAVKLARGHTDGACTGIGDQAGDGGQRLQLGVSTLLLMGLMQPKMAVNAGQHKIVHLLKTL